jgi:hypothetical protein
MARAVQTAIDSLNFFVESRNVGNIINAVTTAGATGVNSADQVNTDQKGAMIFVTFSSVTVNTATLALTINAKDVSAGTYFPYIRVSVDGITNTGPGQWLGIVYMGADSASPFLKANTAVIGLPIPGTFQVVSSLTITTSASQTGSLTYKVDYANLM